MQDIPFLTVHDSVIIKQIDHAKALKIFNEVLSAEFVFYKLHSEGMPENSSLSIEPTTNRKDFLGICSRVEKKPLPTPEPWELITPPTEQLKKGQPEDWSETIKELESYFLNAQNLNDPIQLNRGTNIISVPQFIQSHLTIVKANNGKKIITPYLKRLQELKSILIKQAIIVNNNKIQ